jgi:hypothetical protein
MAMLEVNWNPGRRELRQFAGMWLLFFGAIGAWLWYRHGGGAWSTGLLSAAGLIGIPGLLFPGIMRPIYVGWMMAAFPIGWTISHLLLGAIFYGVVTPIGLALRIFGHDPMHRTFDPEKDSYWVEHEPAETARYFRTY